MTHKITMDFDMDIEELADRLVQLPKYDLVEFIKLLESKASDGDLTEELYDHFSELHKNYCDLIENEEITKVVINRRRTL